jgi:hypothetical protein
MINAAFLLQPAHDEVMFPLTFKWEKRNNLPYSICVDNSCIVNGKVYINTTKGNPLEYTPETDTWVELLAPTLEHGMLSLNGKLTLVGGLPKESTNALDYLRLIRVWDSNSKQWIEPYPPMPMGRVNVGCVSYKHYLIVAGGYTEGKVHSTTSVEILDTKSRQWFKAPPMMYNGRIQLTIIGKSLYVSFIYRGIGTASKSLLRVSLPILISHTLQGKNRDTAIWEKMPDIPLCGTTLFLIGNMLLTAGGSPSGTVGAVLSTLRIKKDNASADIHLFNPHTNEWVKIGELPEPAMLCACCVLPSGKLLVAGGECFSTISGSGALSTVYTATIAGSFFEPPHY